MRPLRKLREAGPPTSKPAAPILSESVLMHSPILIRPIVGREFVAIAISNSSHSPAIRASASSRVRSTTARPCCAGGYSRRPEDREPGIAHRR
jgi:hypothetical protein